MPKISKEVAEVAIYNKFLGAYGKSFHSSLLFIDYDDRPDFIALDVKTGDKIGIEITGVYQNVREARIQYWDIDNWNKFEGSLDNLINELNTRLEDKSNKSWNYIFDGKLILAVWIGSLVYQQKSDFDFIRNKISIPNNAFIDIWLILRDDNDSSPILYPLQINSITQH